MQQGINIFWFKRDLRINDNPALSQACRENFVLPLYIFEPELWEEPDLSYRHYIFLKEALIDLKKQLQTIGTNLVVLTGSAVDIFDSLNTQLQINKIFSHQETWNLWTYNRDKGVKSWARDNKVTWIESINNGVVRNLDNRNGWSKRWYASISAPITAVPHKVQSIMIKSDTIPDAVLFNLST